MMVGSDRHSNSVALFLTCILLAVVLPAFTLDSLLCYYCPLQPKGKSCPNITSQCPPGQHCSSSRGRYGSIHVLSAQGCVDAELCGSREVASYRGVKYNVTHTCCCKDKCNSKLKSDSDLKTLLRLITAQTDDGQITAVLKEDSWDSCENYTPAPA